MTTKFKQPVLISRFFWNMGHEGSNEREWSVQLIKDRPRWIKYMVVGRERYFKIIWTKKLLLETHSYIRPSLWRRWILYVVFRCFSVYNGRDDDPAPLVTNPIVSLWSSWPGPWLRSKFVNHLWLWRKEIAKYCEDLFISLGSFSRHRASSCKRLQSGFIVIWW